MDLRRPPGEGTAGSGIVDSSGPDSGGNGCALPDTEKCTGAWEDECSAEYPVCGSGTGKIQEGDRRNIDGTCKEKYGEAFSSEDLRAGETEWTGMQAAAF